MVPTALAAAACSVRPQLRASATRRLCVLRRSTCLWRNPVFLGSVALSRTDLRSPAFICGDRSSSSSSSSAPAAASTDGSPTAGGDQKFYKERLLDGQEEVLTEEEKKEKDQIIKELTRRLSGPLADEDGNVPTGEDRPIAIEVDGPSHFYANSKRYTAYTKLKHRLLTRMGYKVLHVPYFDWRKLRGAKEREDYMRKKLLEEPTEWLDPDDEKYYNSPVSGNDVIANETAADPAPATPATPPPPPRGRKSPDVASSVEDGQTASASAASARVQTQQQDAPPPPPPRHLTRSQGTRERTPPPQPMGTPRPMPPPRPPGSSGPADNRGVHQKDTQRSERQPSIHFPRHPPSR